MLTLWLITDAAALHCTDVATPFVKWLTSMMKMGTSEVGGKSPWVVARCCVCSFFHGERGRTEIEERAPIYTYTRAAEKQTKWVATIKRQMRFGKGGCRPRLQLTPAREAESAKEKSGVELKTKGAREREKNSTGRLRLHHHRGNKIIVVLNV